MAGFWQFFTSAINQSTYKLIGKWAIRWRALIWDKPLMPCSWMLCLALLPLLSATLLWGQPEAVISWVSTFHYLNVLSYSRPITVGPVDGGMKSLKLWSGISCSFIKMAVSAFCNSDSSDQHSECQEAHPVQALWSFIFVSFYVFYSDFSFLSTSETTVTSLKDLLPMWGCFGRGGMFKNIHMKKLRP